MYVLSCIGITASVAGNVLGNKDGSATAAGILYPSRIASDSNGVLYVTNSDSLVRKITTTGKQ